MQRLLREGRGDLVGWKLGVTSRAKQQQVGVDSPIYGFLATDHVLDVGEPLDDRRAHQPALRAGDRLRDGPRPGRCPRHRDRGAGGHRPASPSGIEVLDSRYTDYRFTMPDVVADNASAGRYVVGAPVPLDGIDLRLVGVVLEHNGDVVATASGAASLGHPAAAVAWLVRSLAGVRRRAAAPAT